MSRSKSSIKTSPDKAAIVYERTASDILKITEDKLKLKLKDLKESIENKSNIFCYFGIVLALSITLITSDFNKTLGIDANTWQAIFICGLFLFIIFTIKSLWDYFRNKKDINSIIKNIKKEE